jgi:cytochrome c-type biogenesis protein CcmH
MSLFITLGIVCTLIAAGLVVTPLFRASTPDSGAPWAATMTALILPAAALMLYLTATNHDWQPPRTAANSNSDEAKSMEAAIAELEERLSQSPDDLDGWLLLGRSRVQLQQFESARQAFAKALELSGGSNPEAKLGWAETLLLKDGNAALEEAGPMIEDVLRVQPQNAKALWYGGMVALARDDFSLVQERWQKLLALSPPDSVRQVVEKQLAGLGIAVDSPAVSAGIQVTISVPDALKAQIKAGAPLFLVARDDSAGGPPVAVVRQTIGDLPVTLNISDANVMIPGRSLNDLQRVRLIARVANSGDPIAKPGDIFGEALWTGESADEAVNIVMDRRVER